MRRARRESRRGLGPLCRQLNKRPAAAGFTVHSLEKTLLINRNTKILQRPMVQTTSSPLINARTPPTIKAVNKLFMEKGVELAVKAAKDALEDWGGRLEDVTHLSGWRRDGELGSGPDLLAQFAIPALQAAIREHQHAVARPLAR